MRPVDVVIQNAKGWIKGKNNFYELMPQIGYLNYTVHLCERVSDRGKIEWVYVLTCGIEQLDMGRVLKYVTDTGRGHGGTGTLIVRASGFVDKAGRYSVTDDALMNKKCDFWVYK